jgi:hypothetical protein
LILVELRGLKKNLAPAGISLRADGTYWATVEITIGDDLIGNGRQRAALFYGIDIGKQKSMTATTR